MKSVILLCVVFIFIVAIYALDKRQPFDDVDEIPEDTDIVDEQGRRIVFDFIVVGAGAAGCIVASRLANETDKQVLFLEGGAQGTGQREVGGIDYVASQFSKDPITGKTKIGQPLTRYDFPLMSDTIRQATDVLDSTWNISAIGYFYAQAKVIGGNQAANGCGWLSPQKADLDAWNLPGYNSTEFWPYILKLQNSTSTGYTSGRNTEGYINIEFASFVPKEQSMFVEAAEQAGYSFGGDMGNGSIGEGWYYLQMTTKNGIRVSTSITHLAKVLGKSNLDFRTSAEVTRVLFDVSNTAVGVEYSDEYGNLRKVYATKEVVIAAGTLQSAKLLFNSGIGPESILTAFGKPHRVINEIVGQKVRNQQRSTLTYVDPNFDLPNFYTYPAASVQFSRDGTGAINKQIVVLTHQVNPSAPYPEVYVLIYTGGYTPTDPYGKNIQVWVYLSQQIYANGTLNLTDSNPLGGTIYTSNALVVEEDAEIIANGFLEMRRVMSHWNGTITEISPGANYTTVEELIPFIQANPATSCHLYSSVPIGDDPSFPLDLRMRVRGVQNLRVVGAPAVPKSVFFGMQALAMAFGEKGTDLIKEDHGL